MSKKSRERREKMRRQEKLISSTHSLSRSLESARCCCDAVSFGLPPHKTICVWERSEIGKIKILSCGKWLCRALTLHPVTPKHIAFYGRKKCALLFRETLHFFVVKRAVSSREHRPGVLCRMRRKKERVCLELFSSFFFFGRHFRRRRMSIP